jgi:NAD(P)-dependent dehydrogenase (short-subunit alcohol dehydrogenase family)
MSSLLKDKVAVITGAGRGIGKAFALRFAEEGAKIFIPDISLERAEEAANEIKNKGGEASAILTDISNESDTLKMAEKAVQLYGKIDILVNNAAIWYGLNITAWDQWKPEDWDRMFAVNVKGTWLCIKAVAPYMTQAHKGKIINIASNVPRVPAAQAFLPYACSKGAIYTLTQAMARALGASGINVNAIAPGYTTTEATMNQRDVESTFKLATSEQTIQRRENPADLVETAVFLASAGSDFISGQTIYVDGGTVML